MAKKTSSKNQIGAWAFLVGVALAIIIGALISIWPNFLSSSAYSVIFIILVIIGIVIGFLNVNIQESQRFLLASLALVIVSYMAQGFLLVVPFVKIILTVLLVMFVPTTVIVALKSVFEISKD